jgi:hypothetical protein
MRSVGILAMVSISFATVRAPLLLLALRPSLHVVVHETEHHGEKCEGSSDSEDELLDLCAVRLILRRHSYVHLPLRSNIVHNRAREQKYLSDDERHPENNPPEVTSNLQAPETPGEILLTTSEGTYQEVTRSRMEQTRPNPGVYALPQQKQLVTAVINTCPASRNTNAVAASPVDASEVYPQVR